MAIVAACRLANNGDNLLESGFAELQRSFGRAMPLQSDFA